VLGLVGYRFRRIPCEFESFGHIGNLVARWAL
jgi:hypothetical protein